MTEKLVAWQTEDGDLVVWGTHDREVARVTLKAAIHDGMIVVEDDFDWETEAHFWDWYAECMPREFYAYEKLVDEEYWPDWLVVDIKQERTVPIMRIAR